jgi:AraC-like DNA-binding protein
MPVEGAPAVVDDLASAKRLWAGTVARVDRRLRGIDAKRSYDTLGQVSVGRTDFRVDKGFSLSVSGPATFSLSMLLEGKITSCLDGGVPLLITAGSAVVFASRQSVSGTNHFDSKQRIRLIDIRYDRAFLEEVGGVPLSRFAHELLVDRSLPGDGTTFIAFPARKDLIDVGARLFDCDIADDAARRLFLQAKSLEALALTIATLSGRQPPSSGLTESDRAKLTAARQLLHDRYDEHWTIATLARAVGLSERKLKTGFRFAIGNSVHAYLKDVRLKAAAAMLSEGRSVTDVAFSVGFENLSHFSKVFRAVHGVNPRDFPRG